MRQFGIAESSSSFPSLSPADTLARLDSTPAFGVYVHIPFCASRCDYCDFATWTDRDHLIESYVDACVRQLRTDGHNADRKATTVFFGGGTPSLIEPSQLMRILDAVNLCAGAEVTVECNPDAASTDHMREYADHGVNRVSFGVQSTAPHVLQALGRTHDRANVARAIDAAREHEIHNINLDVIYGTPGESTEDWSATLDDVLAFDPTHVSAYALTVEPATPLGISVKAGIAAAPDEDDQAEKYEMTDERLGAHGFTNYEISNWSKPSQACTHNLLYWTMGEYLAIGCAAHGHLNGERFWNVRTPERFISAIQDGVSPVTGSERLDDDSRAEEAFTLALRTSKGARLRSSEVIGGGSEQMDASLDAILEQFADAGLLQRTSCSVTLTAAGRLLANDVTARLLNAGITKRCIETEPAGYAGTT